MSVADRLYRLISEVLGARPELRLRGWDGSEVGPAKAPVLVVRSRDAVRRLLWRPDELGLGRAYVAGDLEVEGDIFAVLESLPMDRQLTVDLGRREKAKVAVLAASLGAVGLEPAPPREEAALVGSKHSKSRDRAAVSHHYDVGNDFYRLVLGESMVYSCAYWRRPDDPAYGLEDAQRDKLDLVCRKLGLHENGGPDVRLLDVGCGWGSLLLHAATTYGVSGVGVTLSTNQAELARARVTEAGLGDRIDIRLQDYRDVPDGPFDVIASVGMAEHVGQAAFHQYTRRLFELVRPGGRLLNHQVSRRPGTRRSDASFIDAYVFPDGDLLPVAETAAAIEDAGFEVRDVESLREHYARTLRCWVANLEAEWDRAVALTSPGRARVWRLYMAGSALSFEAGRIGVNQIISVRPGPHGESFMPPTRAYLGDVL